MKMYGLFQQKITYISQKENIFVLRGEILGWQCVARQADETGAETQEGRGRGKSEVLFWVLQQISLEKCKYKYDISLDLKNISRDRNIFVEDGKSCKSCLVFYPTSLSAKKLFSL